MRVVHLSTYDLFGGAARAAYRLHTALSAAGVDSRMLVRQRRSERPDVSQPSDFFRRAGRRLQRRIDRLPLALKPPQAKGFSIGWVPDALAKAIDDLAPDVVHVHWTADGFMRPETIAQFKAPTVWTMHDMWAFTGGCHYSGECRRFSESCGRCPLLGAKHEFDLSRRGWLRRKETYKKKEVIYVAPSRWIANQALGSSLLRAAEVVVIPNGFDTECFAPTPRADARLEFGLAQGAMVLMAGAAQFSANARKGFDHLVAALGTLRTLAPSLTIELALFGSETELPAELHGYCVRNLGVIGEEKRLAKAYAAADLFVAPSLADNLPNTVIEAMSAGIPVVAYDVGGIADIIDHGVNGLLAPAADSAALARALHEALGDGARRALWGRKAREKAVREFDLAKAVASHQALYQRVAGGT